MMRNLGIAIVGAFAVLCGTLFVGKQDVAWAQCNGHFPANTLCGSITAGLPKPTTLSGFVAQAPFSIYAGASPSGAARTSVLNLSGNDSDPTLVHNSAAGLAINGLGTNASLVFGISANGSLGFPTWIQSRDSGSDGALHLLLNPLGGAVGINTTNPGIGLQVGDNWCTDSYLPFGTPCLIQGAISTFGNSGSGTPQGINSYVQTLGIGSGGSTQAVNGFAFANNAAAHGAWSFYGEAHRLTALDYVSAMELAVVNRFNDSGDLAGGVQIDCGDGLSTTAFTYYGCGFALNITTNNHASQLNNPGFQVGIRFAPTSVDSSAHVGYAIQLPTNKGITFFENTLTSLTWSIYSTATAGSNSLVLSNSDAVFNTQKLYLASANNTEAIFFLGFGATGDRAASLNMCASTSCTISGDDFQLQRQGGVNGATTVRNITGTGSLILGARNTNLIDINTGATGIQFIAYGAGVLQTNASGVVSAGSIALGSLATQATNTVLGNATSGTAVPTALAVGSCSTASSALIWTTNTGFGCNTSITAAAVPVGGITGLGTGVATALAVNIGTAGSFVTNGGALGSPSSAGTLPAFTLGGTISGGGNQINNVVIGTTTPLAGTFTTLTLGGGSATAGLAVISSGGVISSSSVCALVTAEMTCTSSASFEPEFTMYNTTADATAGYFIVKKSRSGGAVSANDGVGTFNWIAHGNTGNQTVGQLTMQVDGAYAGDAVAGKMNISTNSGSGFNTGIWLFGSGLIGVGASGAITTSDVVAIGGQMSTNGKVYMTGISTTTANQSAYICRSSANELVADTSAINLCVASSRDFKRDIEPLTSDSGLSEIMKLRPVSFRYKPEGIFHNDRSMVGLIAEDVEEVDRRLVGYDNKGKPHSVQYEFLTAILAKAIQELKADNDNIRDELRQLKRAADYKP